jgi:hypothetical protein
LSKAFVMNAETLKIPHLTELWDPFDNQFVISGLSASSLFVEHEFIKSKLHNAPSLCEFHHTHNNTFHRNFVALIKVKFIIIL